MNNRKKRKRKPQKNVKPREMQSSGSSKPPQRRIHFYKENQSLHNRKGRKRGSQESVKHEEKESSGSSKPPQRILRSEVPERKRGPSLRFAAVFLYFGIIALGTAIYYDSSILAFIGLGLTLWGGLFFFIMRRRYVKLEVSEATALSPLVTIDNILTELNYQGQGVYLPPRQFEESKECTVFVSIEKGVKIPKEKDLHEKKKRKKKIKGISLTPPGQDLLNLYERELKKDLSKTNLDYLITNLPKLLIENLEIVEEFEISQKEENVIYVKMKGSIHGDLCSYLKNNTKICSRLGCPLCSSIACAIARVTGKAVTIEKDDLSTNGKTIETWYRLVES